MEEEKTVDHLIDVKEAAEMLRLTVSRIRYEVHIGRIPHVKLGRSVRFNRGELAKWIATHKKGGTQ